MTEKEKIRNEIEKLKAQLIRGACSSQIAMETRCKEEAYNEVLTILDTLQEEPVCEELEDERVRKELIKKREMCKKKLVIAVDFNGTCVTVCLPRGDG